MSDTEDKPDIIQDLAFFQRLANSLKDTYANLPYASRIDTIKNLFQLSVSSYEKEKEYTDKYIVHLKKNLDKLLDDLEKLNAKRVLYRQHLLRNKYNIDSNDQLSEDTETEQIVDAIKGIVATDEDFIDVLTNTNNITGIKRKLNDIDNIEFGELKDELEEDDDDTMTVSRVVSPDKPKKPRRT